MPDYDFSRPGEVRVEIPGRILDERYTRLLLQQPKLSLSEVMLLDRVQKGRRLTKEQHKELKAFGLVEGRYPNLIVSGAIAKATGETARHIRQSGFDKQYYLDLILRLAETHAPVGRKEIDDLLLEKLPDRLTRDQKRVKVQNLVQELRREGRIENRGTRGEPAWFPAEPESLL